MIDYTLMSAVERKVYGVLLDGLPHSSKELVKLCTPSAPRDVISRLRHKHGLSIHGKGSWILDERHISGDAKSALIASAEAKVKHSENSARLAKRETLRLPSALDNNRNSRAELADLKDSPPIKVK